MPPAANSAEAAQVRPIGRPFEKGRSGNPNGRPKGVAKQFRALVNDDPTVFAEMLVNIAEDPKQKPEVVIAAIKEYLDRGWGKAPAYAPVEGGDPLGRDQLDERIGALVDDLAARRQSKSRSTAASGEVASPPSKT